MASATFEFFTGAVGGVIAPQPAGECPKAGLSELNSLMKQIKITAGWLYQSWLRAAPRPVWLDEQLNAELTCMRQRAADLDEVLADRLAAEAATLSRILILRGRLERDDVLAAARRLAALPREMASC